MNLMHLYIFKFSNKCTSTWTNSQSNYDTVSVSSYILLPCIFKSNEFEKKIEYKTARRASSIAFADRYY